MAARGGYTLKQIAEMGREEILFIHYHQELLAQEQMKLLLTSLGVLWNRDDVGKADSRNEDEMSEILIPLALSINPKIMDFIKKQPKKTGQRSLSDGTPIEGEVRSMGDLSKEDFYKMIGQPIPTRLPQEAKEELKKKWIKAESKQG